MIKPQRNFVPNSDVVINQLGFLFDNEQLLQRLVKAWKRAGKCQGCKYLHLGQKVGHNHCSLDREDSLGDGCRFYKKTILKICVREQKCPVGASI